MEVGTAIWRRGRVWLLFGLLALVSVAALAAPGHASAKLTWSAPAQIDTTGGSTLAAVACPSASECAVVDSSGQLIDLDPSSPAGAHAVPIAPGQTPDAISCP